MLSRALAAGRLFRAASQIRTLPAVCNMGGHTPSHWKTDKQLVEEYQVTYNHMPTPTGSWQEDYQKKNAKYNMNLGISIAAFIITLVAMKQSGVLYLHSSPSCYKNIEID